MPKTFPCPKKLCDETADVVSVFTLHYSTVSENRGVQFTVKCKWGHTYTWGAECDETLEEVLADLGLDHEKGVLHAPTTR